MSNILSVSAKRGGEPAAGDQHSSIGETAGNVAATRVALHQHILSPDHRGHIGMKIVLHTPQYLVRKLLGGGSLGMQYVF